MSKITHHHIRAYDRALELLIAAGEADAQGRGHTPEARQILTCLGKPADRARRKAEEPPKSKEDQDWKRARDDADDAFSKYIRFRDTKGGATLAERRGICVTCEKPKRGDELQCGHWLSRKHFGTRWHEFNAGGQCPWDNSQTGGQGKPEEFETAIKMMRGSEWPGKLRTEAKFNARKPSVEDMQKITEKYRVKLGMLKEREGIS